MLGWIEKVVPRPPADSPIRVIVEKELQAQARAQLARQLPEAQSGHLTEGRRQDEANESHNPRSAPTSPGRTMVSWISQGLGKVIPQPTPQSTPVKLQALARSFETSVDIPNLTEVQSIKDEDDDGIEVTELDVEEEDEEHSELQSSSDNNAPEKAGGKKVFTWLAEEFGRIMPQPENVRKTEEGVSEGREPKRAFCKENNRGTPGKGTASPSASRPRHRTPSGSRSNLSVSLFPRSLGGHGISVFEWLVQGLEKAMPQPVTKAIQNGQIREAAEKGSGQARSKGA